MGFIAQSYAATACTRHTHLYTHTRPCTDVHTRRPEQAGCGLGSLEPPAGAVTASDCQMRPNAGTLLSFVRALCSVLPFLFLKKAEFLGVGGVGKLVPTRTVRGCTLHTWQKGTPLGHRVRGAVGFLEEMLLSFFICLWLISSTLKWLLLTLWSSFVIIWGETIWRAPHSTFPQPHIPHSFSQIF